MTISILCPAHSHTSHSQLITPAPEQSLLGVMGVSDWDFLCPAEEAGTLDSDEDTSKRPSLDDFDGEIAVFQVCQLSLSLISNLLPFSFPFSLFLPLFLFPLSPFFHFLHYSICSLHFTNHKRTCTCTCTLFIMYVGVEYCTQLTHYIFPTSI